jgi:sugar lactone lactonase YvrE
MFRRILLLVVAAVGVWPQAAFAVGTTAAFQNFGPVPLTQCPNPEGIAVDPAGHVYAASFPLFGAHTAANVCVIDSGGNVVDIIAVPPGPAGQANLLGELFVPGQGLYVGDFGDGSGNGRLLLIDPSTHAIRTLASGFQAPNAIAEDRHRNLYVSDSFLGAVWKVAPDGTASVWVASPLLQPHGNPPFGANGVAFDRTESNLYVANTADDRIVRVPVGADGGAGTPVVFAQGVQGTGVLDGADGIMFDVQGNLYVCANQANEVQVLDPSGQLIARYVGSGANALDFPASLVFKGKTLYVTDLALTAPADSRLSVMEAPRPGAPIRR